MLTINQNDIGLDSHLNHLAKELHDGLNAKWELPTTPKDKTLKGFGRLYVINREGKKTIERFKQKSDYQNENVADKSKFFFIHRKPEVPVDGLNFRTKVELFFILDLNIVKPGNTSRNDIQAKADILEIIQSMPKFWIDPAVGIETDPDQVMGEFVFEQQKTMQPIFVFKITLGIEYAMDDECKCC